MLPNVVRPCCREAAAAPRAPGGGARPPHNVRQALMLVRSGSSPIVRRAHPSAILNRFASNGGSDNVRQLPELSLPKCPSPCSAGPGARRAKWVTATDSMLLLLSLHITLWLALARRCLTGDARLKCVSIERAG